MKKKTTTICLAVISLVSFAQDPGIQLQNLPLKNLSYIPSKSFTSLSYTGSDSLSFYTSRIASSKGFYISKFEVTNKEYREFVLYVKDSAAHSLLNHYKKGTNRIDWSRRINWDDPLLDPLMLSAEEKIFGKRSIHTDRIVYALDLSGQQELISIYPDTLVWMNDFAYSYNEPLVKKYFSGPVYDNYPVVGINLKQAMAFCQWKSSQMNKLLKQKGSEYELVLKLPTNTEWEAAAAGENNNYNLFSSGRGYNSNFGTITDRNGFMVKDFNDDGYFYTNPVNHYPPGSYGLYNIKGNVAEWTSDAAAKIMEADERKELNESFIAKGGGWDSNPFYLQAGTCRFFRAEAAHSYLGFRYVVYVIMKQE